MVACEEISLTIIGKSHKLFCWNDTEMTLKWQWLVNDTNSSDFIAYWQGTDHRTEEKIFFQRELDAGILWISFLIVFIQIFFNVNQALAQGSYDCNIDRRCLALILRLRAAAWIDSTDNYWQLPPILLLTHNEKEYFIVWKGNSFWLFTYFGAIKSLMRSNII